MKERSSKWSQMAAMAELGGAAARIMEFHPGLLQRRQEPNRLTHPLQLFQACQRGTRSEVEQLGLEPALGTGQLICSRFPRYLPAGFSGFTSVSLFYLFRKTSLGAFLCTLHAHTPSTHHSLSLCLDLFFFIALITVCPLVISYLPVIFIDLAYCVDPKPFTRGTCMYILVINEQAAFE